MTVSDASVIRIAIDFFKKTTLLLLRIKVLYCLPQGIDMVVAQHQDHNVAGG